MTVQVGFAFDTTTFATLVLSSVYRVPPLPPVHPIAPVDVPAFVDALKVPLALHVGATQPVLPVAGFVTLVDASPSVVWYTTVGVMVPGFVPYVYVEPDGTA